MTNRLFNGMFDGMPYEMLYKMSGVHGRWDIRWNVLCSVETSLLASSVVCQITIRGPDALHLARNLEYAILAGLFDPLKPQFPVELHHDTASDDTASDDADDAASTLPTTWAFGAWSNCDDSTMSDVT